jgi:NAD-dependent SIR2 family protein deacetylase
MAFSAHKNKEELEEHFDSSETLDLKAAQLAHLILKSKHFIAFTGAGISTACGIPDFRGPNGCWTLRAAGKAPVKGTTSTKAIPSMSHMALVQLVNNGNLKCVISQNTDGLHRKSGLGKTQVCELHGNTNKEVCTVCKREYLRDGKVRNNSNVHDHKTGNKCDDPNCRGDLKDTIINFHEKLDADVLDEGFRQANAADLCLSLGSSLTVSPANDIPEIVGQKGGLVVVNLQITPLDKLCCLRVYGKIDDFMARVMRCLEQPIPEWRLRRHLSIYPHPDKSSLLKISDVDEHGGMYTYINQLAVATKPSLRKKDGTFTAKLDDAIEISFKGFYHEPPFQTTAKCGNMILSFDPTTRTWASELAGAEFPERPYYNPSHASAFASLSATVRDEAAKVVKSSASNSAKAAIQTTA